MKGKKRFLYNMMFILVLLLTIYNIFSHYEQMNDLKEQVLTLYKDKQQQSTNLFAYQLKNAMTEHAYWDRNWEHTVTSVKQQAANDPSTWVYVSCNKIIVYCKNQDLEKKHETIPYEEFVKDYDSDTLVLTQRQIQVGQQELIVGLVKPKNLVLSETNYNTMYAMLMIKNVLISLILTLLACYFLWKTIRVTKQKDKKQKEIILLNQKIEKRNEEIKQQVVEKETEVVQFDKDDFKYEKDLLLILLEKANIEKYYPIGIQVIRYYMGNLYFTKNQMKLIEKQLHELVSGRCEVFETGKGEFVFLILRKDVEDMNTLFELLREKAIAIAKHNNIEVHSSKKILTGIVPDLREVLREQIKDLSIF